MTEDSGDIISTSVAQSVPNTVINSSVSGTAPVASTVLKCS